MTNTLVALSSSTNLNTSSAIALFLEDLKEKTAHAHKVEGTSADAETGSPVPASLTNMAEICAAVAGILSELLASNASAQSSKAAMNAEASNKMILALQTVVSNTWDQVNQQIAAYQAAQEASSHESWWEKMINGLLIGVGALVTLIDPVAGVMMMAMGILNLTNGMSVIQGGISDLFQKMGIPADIANLTADCVIFIAVFVATVLTAGGDSEALVSQAARVAQTVMKVVTATGDALMMSPTLFSDATVLALENSNMTPAEKQQIEASAAMAQMIIGAIFALVGAGTSMACSSLSKGASLGSKFAKEAASDPLIAGLAQRASQMASSAGSRLSNLLARITKMLPTNLVRFFESAAKCKFTQVSFSVIKHMDILGGAANGTNQAIYNFAISDTMSTEASTQAALAIVSADEMMYKNVLIQLSNAQQTDAKDFGAKLAGLNSEISAFISAIETMGQSEARALMA